MEIKTGDPVILTDAFGLEEHGLSSGDKGYANVVVNVDGQDLVMFKPEDDLKFFYIDLSRVVLDEEALVKSEEGGDDPEMG